jgi:redox-sensitive bicupin YhaK (pirin superfamily)
MIPSTNAPVRDRYEAQAIRMGHLPVMQPFPLPRLQQLSPFLLLHHFGPRKVLPGVDPLGIDAHPHRGFEPVTFLFQGEIEHRDSRGNEGVLKVGDVQWMTAGRGIIHSEKASRAFVEAGGTLEGIQLWVNLPAEHKMVQPAYQEFRAADLTEVSGTGWRLALVSGTLPWREGHGADGEWPSAEGPARTHTPVTTAMLHAEDGAAWSLGLPAGQQAGLYVLDGAVTVNGTRLDKYGFLRLGDEGGAVRLTAEGNLRALWMAGRPIDEPVVSHGPFVMNTQTQILEAMRDYQMGKMGVLLPA